jgi:hypothetical protein
LTWIVVTGLVSWGRGFGRISGDVHVGSLSWGR